MLNRRQFLSGAGAAFASFSHWRRSAPKPVAARSRPNALPMPS